MNIYIRFKRISALALAFTLIFSALQLVLPLYPGKCAAAGTASSSPPTSITPLSTYCQMTGKVQGVITGGVTRTGKVGLMLVDSFSSEDNSTFKIIKQIDVASPKILSAFSTNEILTDVTLNINMLATYSTTSTSEFTGYTIKLTNAQITGRRVFTEVSTSYLTYEEITFKYESIQETNYVTGDKLRTITNHGPGIFCSIKGESGSLIQGAVLQRNYNGLMYLESFDIDIAKPTGQDEIAGNSDTTSSTLTIVKELDRASPILQSAATNMELLSEIAIDIYMTSIKASPGPGWHDAYSIRLKNATITNRRIYQDKGTVAHPLKSYEEISLTFESIEEIDPVNSTSAVFDINN